MDVSEELLQLSGQALDEIANPLHQLAYPERTHRALPLAEQVHGHLTSAGRLLDLRRPCPAAREIRLAIDPLDRLFHVWLDEGIDERTDIRLVNLLESLYLLVENVLSDVLHWC